MSAKAPATVGWLGKRDTSTPASSTTSDDDAETKALTTRLKAEGWTELKMLAFQQRSTVNKLVREAINDLLRKHGKQPLA